MTPDDWARIIGDAAGRISSSIWLAGFLVWIGLLSHACLGGP